MGSGIDRLSQLVGNPAAGVQPTTPKIEEPKLSGVDRLSQLVRQNAPAITPTGVKAEEPTVAPTPAKTPSLADATNLQETRDALERQYNDALAANGGQPSTQSDALMKQMLNLDKWIDQQHSSGGYEDNVVNTVRGGLEGSAGGFVGAARFATEARESGEDRLKNLVAGLYNPEQRAAYEAAFNANRERQHENGIAADPQKLIATSDRLADQSAQHIEQAKEGLGTVGRTLVDVGVAGTQMLGDAAGNLIMPGGGLALMGIRSFGSASEDARRKGADLGRQFAYALPVAATEVLTEKMFDGLSGIFGKGAADDAVDALISKLAKTQAGQNALRALANMGGEALEEAVSGLVDPMLQNIIDDRQGEGVFRNYTPEAFADLGYSALVGGILGGLGGSVDIMKNPDLNAKIAAEQAAGSGTPAQAQNVTAQSLGASQATPNTTPAENAVQSDADPSNATQPTDALAQVILDIQRSGAEKATKAQVEAVMNDAAAMQRLGVEPATAENGKTAAQVQGEVRDALAQAIVESQQTSASNLNTTAPQNAEVTANATPAAPPTASANTGFHDSTGTVGKATASFLDKVAKLTRTSIEIDPNVDDVVNGQIIGNRIILQKASDLDLIKTGKHEITHRLQDLAPEAYKTYRDYAVNALAEKGDVNALIARYQETYKQVGQNLTPDQAKDEIAADFTEALITEAEKGSTESFEKLAAHDAKAAKGFVQAIRDFIAKVKALFSGKKAAQDEVSRATFGVELDKLEQAAKLWDSLLNEGARAAQELDVEANENAASEETASNSDAKKFSLQSVPTEEYTESTAEESGEENQNGNDERVYERARQGDRGTRGFSGANRSENRIDVGSPYEALGERERGRIRAGLRKGLNSSRKSSQIVAENLIEEHGIEKLANLFYNRMIINGESLQRLERIFPALREELSKAALESEEIRRNYIVTPDSGRAAWTPERIDYLYGYYSNGNPGSQRDYAKGYATRISPEDFLSLTATAAQRANLEVQTMTYGDLDVDRMRGELRETPFLVVDLETGEVTGHEGRHRMILFDNAGINSVPIVVIPYEQGDKYHRSVIGSLDVTGEERANGKAPGKVTLQDIIPLSANHRADVEQAFGGNAEIRYSLKPVQSVSGVEYDTPAPAYSGNEMLSAQQDGVEGARDSLKNNPLAAFTAESVTPGPKNTSRLAQNAATKYTPERAKAAGMTRKQYEEMFRYRIRSEGESTSRAKGIVYDTSSGEKVFLKDADPGSYDNLLTALRDAPAWNDIMVDTANLISKELETRSRNGEIPTSEYRQWLDNIREHATNTGRGTQAWAKWARLMRNVSTDGRLYMMQRSLERIAKDLGRSVDMSISDELKDAYLNAANEEARDAVVEQIQKEAVAKLPASALEKWNALRYVNMLGNVKTQIRNVAGNVGMQALTKAKDKVAASIEGIASVLSGGKLERTKVLHANRALVKAATDYYNDSTNGIASAALGDSKYVEGRAKATDAFEKGVLDLRAKNTFGKANPLRYYQRATNWAMEAGDVIFNRPAFTHALAGWLQAHKVTADQFSNESWRESHADLVDRATNYAIKEAQEATFRDSNALSSWVSGIARGRNTPKAIKAAAEGVLPFRKTPANVFMRAYEYSPLGLIDTAVKAAGVKSGKATGADVVNSLSKALTGTALFGLGMWLKSLGLLRGGDDDDKDQEGFESMQGHQNYAIEIPAKITVAGHEIEVPKALQNASYTLDWITPSAMPLFMGSEFYRLMSDKGLEVKDVEQALTSLADPMIQMSMLQGVENTISDLKYGENSSFLQLGVSLALSYLTQGLTNTLLGQAERTLEKTRKTTYTDQNSPLPNYIQRAIGKGSAKIPGVEYGQIDYIDEWGRTQDNPDALTNAVLQFLSPGYLSRINTTDVDKELQRLADNTDVGTGIFPDRPGKYITVNGENVYLSAQQYESYARDAGQTKLEVVRALINSNAYKNMSDEDKAYAIGRAYDYANQVAKAHTLGDYTPDKWVINTEKAANDPRVNLNPAYVMSYKALLAQYKDDGMNTSSANAAARQVLMNDGNLTARQKEALDEIVFSDGIYLPKDIEVDYTDKESFTISQLTDSAQRHWPSVKAQFNIPYQDYAKIWSIRQNDDYTADEKRQMFTGMGYDGYALYKALGAKVS